MSIVFWFLAFLVKWGLPDGHFDFSLCIKTFKNVSIYVDLFRVQTYVQYEYNYIQEEKKSSILYRRKKKEKKYQYVNSDYI